MNNYYALIQVPVTVKVQFEAEDDKDAVKKAEEMVPFERDNEINGILVSVTGLNSGPNITPDWCELNNSDTCYLEVGKGEEYKDENSIIFKEDYHKY
jgi:hypothetical protein